jgi:aryl-alcohol dehydrogenase-like predicted oxidoreductase
MTEVENSLRRLQTDYIDLYQIHRPDPDTDIEETLSALSDLIRNGKVRVIGASTMPASDIVEALAYRPPALQRADLRRRPISERAAS